MKNRKRSTDRKGKAFSTETREKVWARGKTIRGRDPEKYKKDDCGNIIFKASYGKETDMGWEIDHRKPVALYGTDHLNNLRPLKSSANAAKGDSYPWKC